MPLETSIVYLEVDSIVPNNYNPNEMLSETFESLLQDAKEHGAEALDPILVRPLEFVGGKQQYEIIDGENRWRAVKQLGWQRIRGIIRKVSLDEAKAINYRKNRERGNLNPFKEAKLFYDEWERGNGKLNLEEIAEKYGLGHRARVSEKIKIHTDLSEEAKQILFGRPNISSQAQIIASIPDAEKQKELAQKIVSLGLSVRQTETQARKLTTPPTVNPFEPPSDPHYNFECPCGRKYIIDWTKKMLEQIAS